MCSILLVLVCTLIAFISISDLVQFQTDHLELISVSLQHGHSHKEASAQAQPCYSPPSVVFAPERNTSVVIQQAPTYQAAASTTSFSGSNLYCPADARDGVLCAGTVEMPALQKNLLWQARMLCPVWPVMEVMLGSRFRATNAKILTEASAMETESMGCARHLERRAMDPIPQKATVAQKEIQPSCSQNHGRKRQGKGKGVGRAAALWASALSSYAIAGTSLVDWHDPTIEYQLFCNVGQLQWHHGQQGREGQRQAHEIFGCRFATAQRRAARRAAVPRQRGDGPQRPGGNENPPFCGIAAREGQEGTPRGPGRAPPHAWRLEELLSAICGPVVKIYRTIHAAGAHDDGAPQGGPREPLSCKGKFGGVQVRCRPGVQGGVCADERCRRHRTQRGRDIRRAENCGKLSGLSNKSPNATQASRASCAAGSRARPNAQTPSDVHARTVNRCKRRRWHAPVFWGARVNTFAPSIAPGQSHKCDRGELMHLSLQPADFSAECRPVTNESIFNPALKWNHSVLSETNFVDEWMAADLAFHLAHEIVASHACVRPDNVPDTARTDFAHGRTFQSVQFSPAKDCIKIPKAHLPHMHRSPMLALQVQEMIPVTSAFIHCTSPQTRLFLTTAKSVVSVLRLRGGTSMAHPRTPWSSQYPMPHVLTARVQLRQFVRTILVCLLIWVFLMLWMSAKRSCQ